jgi:hypothetical protein
VGHVTWQGIPQPDTRNDGIPARLVLCVGVVPDAYDVVTDASGFFTVTTALPNGSYRWGVKGAINLANTGTLNLSGPTTQVEMGMMLAGDSNNSNIVKTSDFIVLKSTFGRSLGQPGYDARGDFNYDDLVNALDFALQKSNFGHGGAPTNCP